MLEGIPRKIKIIVNPSANPDRIWNAPSAPMIAYQSAQNGQRGFAIWDLSNNITGVTKVQRGIQLLGQRKQVLIQDEIVHPTPTTCWWFAHFVNTSTTATISGDGSSVTLQNGSERLWGKILTGGGVWTVRTARPLPTSPNPPEAYENASYSKLAIQLTGVTNTTLAVWFVPLAPGENPPVTTPAVTSLAPGASTTFTVRFSPSSGTTNGTKNATVNIPNSITTGGALNFAIRGNATDPSPIVSADPVAITIPANSTGNATLSLVNTGHASTTYNATKAASDDYVIARSDSDGIPHEWIEISSGENLGTRITALEGQDDESLAANKALNLGFTFKLFGNSYTKVRVHCNGFVFFDTSGTFNSQYANYRIPSTNLPQAVIAPYWDDCYLVKSSPADPTDSKIYYKQLDAETFVITYANLSFFNTALRTKRMTFQIVLKKSGAIHLNYKYMDNWDSVTVGLQSSTSNGKSIVVKQGNGFSTCIKLVHNNLTIKSESRVKSPIRQ